MPAAARDKTEARRTLLRMQRTDEQPPSAAAELAPHVALVEKCLDGVFQQAWGRPKNNFSANLLVPCGRGQGEGLESQEVAFRSNLSSLPAMPLAKRGPRGIREIANIDFLLRPS